VESIAAPHAKAPVRQSNWIATAVTQSARAISDAANKPPEGTNSAKKEVVAE